MTRWIIESQSHVTGRWHWDGEMFFRTKADAVADADSHRILNPEKNDFNGKVRVRKVTFKVHKPGKAF